MWFGTVTQGVAALLPGLGSSAPSGRGDCHETVETVPSRSHLAVIRLGNRQGSLFHAFD